MKESNDFLHLGNYTADDGGPDRTIKPPKFMELNEGYMAGAPWKWYWKLSLILGVIAVLSVIANDLCLNG